ncbi:hypothetical protein [Teredinibacter haidensis]|uniref:hypothetical protein n=1 Tax=Teredinibacter haidensis TaxID=2731755 RepID=UPI000948F5EE|nr:hypothetical protein [Teredinibacter haidensis]
MKIFGSKIQLGILLLVFVSSFGFAESVVIVHPENDASISAGDVEKLYLAKVKAFPGGSLALALNQTEGSDIRKAFDSGVIGKSESQMKSYWAKLVFTGKAVPLKELASDQEVVELVSKNPSTIGYIDARSVTDAVKVVHRF